MDSVDKSAFYMYVISRNKLARLAKGQFQTVYQNNMTKYLPTEGGKFCNTLIVKEKQYCTVDKNPFFFSILILLATERFSIEIKNLKFGGHFDS